LAILEKQLLNVDDSYCSNIYVRILKYLGKGFEGEKAGTTINSKQCCSWAKIFNSMTSFFCTVLFFILYTHVTPS
jgi:hypothetical protein